MPAERIFKSFFSYARQDAETDPRLVSALSENLPDRVNGMLTNTQFTIFRDSTHLTTGALWESDIEKALQSSDILIVLLTPRWIDSKWCRNEYLMFEQIESARNAGPCVIPILGRDLTREIPNFTTDQRDVYDRILKRQLKPLLSTDFLRQNNARRTLHIEKIADDVAAMVARIRGHAATDSGTLVKGETQRMAAITPPDSWVTPTNPTEKKLDELPDIVVKKLLAALAQRGDTLSAEQAGVSPEAIIRLAQRINAGIDDFDQALLELERAVSIAVEVAEQGRRSSNVGDFVDEVLARIAEKSADGQFDEAAREADTAFAQWEHDEAARRDVAVAGGLKILEAGLRQDILRRDPVCAAARIERMVALEYPDDRVASFAAMRKRQDEWYESGRDKGLNFDLHVSIEAARILVNSASGPDETGIALIDLGTALYALGARESGTARLDEAVEAYRAALLEYARERVPLDWALIQSNLGVALRTLGERENGTERLDEAVNAYRAALQEQTRERVPLQWAATQNNLGMAFRLLGQRGSEPARLNDAVEAYRAALLERTRERVPLDWAMTQNNLGVALQRLGERENGTERLDEAVNAYRAALQEQTRERVPLQWAATQNNLGNAFRLLGERGSEPARLNDAVEAYRAALLERTRERVPLDWAMTQNNLGAALHSIGERESGTARLDEAVEAYRAALQEITRERTPYWHDRMQQNLNAAMALLEARRNEAPS